MVADEAFVDDAVLTGRLLNGLMLRREAVSVQEVIRRLGLEPSTVCERLWTLARRGEVEVLHPVGEDPDALMRGLPSRPDHVFIRRKRAQDSRHAWQARLGRCVDAWPARMRAFEASCV